MKLYFRCKLFLAMITFFTVCNLFAEDARSQLSLLGMLYGGGDKRGLASFLANKNQPGDVKDGVLFVNAMLLEYLKPYDTFNPGNVSAINNITVPFTKSGILSYIIGKRNFVFGTVFGREGELLYPGTIIASLDEQDYNFRLDMAKRRRDVVDKSTAYIKKMGDVQEKLAKKNYITSFQMEEAQIALMTDLMKYETSMRETDEVILNYKSPNMYSDFSGLVSQVYAQIGDEVVSGSPAVELMQIDPIKVKVKFPVAMMDITSGIEKAYVYSDDNNKPITAKAKVFQEDPENIYIYLRNRAITTSKLTRSQKKLTKIFSTHKVKNLLNPQINAFFLPKERKDIAVNVAPVEAFRKDGSGYFLYKINSMDDSQVNKLSAQQVVVDKVYVKLGKIITTTPMDDYNLLKVQSFEVTSKDKTISPGDSVIGYSEQQLKDGESAVIVDVEWLYFPGDKVKVSLPQFTFPGIYVPENSIIHKGEDENYIYLIQNDILKLVRVFVIGYYRGYCIIKSKDVHIGDKMLLIEDTFDDNLSEFFEKLYDGRKVSVIETEEGPRFIQNPHAFNYKAEPLMDEKNSRLPFNTGNGKSSSAGGLSKELSSLKKSFL